MLKKKNLSRIILFCAFISCIFILGRGYFFLTDGFLEKNIYEPPCKCSLVIETPSKEKLEEIKNILKEPFSYLGKGCQSYVFESADKKYVLKFFKYQRFFIKPWLESLSFIPFFQVKGAERKKEKEEKLCKLWEGAYLAFTELQKETKVIFVQLKPQIQWHDPLLLYDKLGIKHEIDLNKVQFILQEKGIPLEIFLKESSSEKKEKVLLNLRALIIEEEERGFTDEDPALLQNTAVLEECPFHADVGQLSRRSTPFSLNNIEERLKCIN